MTAWKPELFEAYLKELEYLVNIDSGSKDHEGIGEVGAFFVKKFTALGWISRKVEFGADCAPCWEIQNNAGQQIDVLLLGHMDTVFPRGTAAERPFRTEAGRAYGPGVADMKAGLLSAYHALKTLQEEQRLKDATVCFALNSEEELSSTYTRSWLEGLARRSRLVLVLEPARPNGALLTSRKGVGRYQLDFTGIAAHSGVNPEKGASAIAELGRWIVELHRLTDFAKGTTVNVGLISGGTAANVVAEHATAKVDLRFSDAAEFDRIEAVIARLLSTPSVSGVKVTVSGGMTRPPMAPTEKTAAICRLIERAGQDCGVEVHWVATGGGSDGNFAAALGIPTIDGLGPVGGNSHSPKEYLELDSVMPRLQLLRKVVLIGTEGER